MPTQRPLFCQTNHDKPSAASGLTAFGSTAFGLEAFGSAASYLAASGLAASFLTTGFLVLVAGSTGLPQLVACDIRFFRGGFSGSR